MRRVQDRVSCLSSEPGSLESRGLLSDLVWVSKLNGALECGWCLHFVGISITKLA